MGGILPVPIPASDPIARPPRAMFRQRKELDPQEGFITEPWVKFFSSQAQSISQNPARVKAVTLTGQTASIAATDMRAGSTAAGLYRLTFYYAIQTAASVSSSISVTFAWTDNTIPRSLVSTPKTGNTTAVVDSASILIYSDGVAQITYATTYASVGGTAMVYSISVVLEQIAA
jgi:hypothetical protein